MAAEPRALRWLLGRLALQNLGRRKARSLLLMAAVAIGTGVIFTSTTLMRSIDASMVLSAFTIRSKSKAGTAGGGKAWPNIFCVPHFRWRKSLTSSRRNRFSIALR